MTYTLTNLKDDVRLYDLLIKAIKSNLTFLDKELKKLENIMCPFLKTYIDESSTVTDSLLTYLSIFYSNASVILDHLWVLDSGIINNSYKKSIVPSKLIKPLDNVNGRCTICFHVADQTGEKLRAKISEISEVWNT